MSVCNTSALDRSSRSVPVLPVLQYSQSVIDFGNRSMFFQTHEYLVEKERRAVQHEMIHVASL